MSDEPRNDSRAGLYDSKAGLYDGIGEFLKGLGCASIIIAFGVASWISKGGLPWWGGGE